MSEEMHAYTVKVRNGHKIVRYTAIARSWFEAWNEAINVYGMRALYSVAPHNARRATR